MCPIFLWHKREIRAPFLKHRWFGSFLCRLCFVIIFKLVVMAFLGILQISLTLLGAVTSVLCLPHHSLRAWELITHSVTLKQKEVQLNTPPKPPYHSKGRGSTSKCSVLSFILSKLLPHTVVWFPPACLENLVSLSSQVSLHTCN